MVEDRNADTPLRRARKAPAIWAGAVVLAVLGLGLLYGMPRTGKEDPGTCAAAGAAARLDPLIQGEVAALNLTKPTAPMPLIAFEGDGHTPMTLADFKGKTVLLNLWATWCVPCRKEMPALDRLQGELGGSDFQVVAVNVDTAKLDRPKRFLSDAGIQHLPFYADPSGTVLQTAKENGPVLGLPTTFLIDRNGCTIATMAGPADWGSEDAKKLIVAAKS